MNRLVDSILKDLGIEPGEHKPSMSFGNIGDLSTPQNRTLGLMINVQSREQTDTGIKLVLDTIEMAQIIPDKEGAGNVTVRKMKTDEELKNKSETY